MHRISCTAGRCPAYRAKHISSAHPVKGFWNAWRSRVAARQVGFGSGFKCNSAVWKARRTIRDSRHAAWAHMVNGNLDCVWKYLEVRCPRGHSGCSCM